MHGLNEGHIAPYTDIEFRLTKYQTYIIMKCWYKSLQLQLTSVYLTHFVLVTPYWGINVGQHWLSRHQAITLKYAHLSSKEDQHFRYEQPLQLLHSYQFAGNRTYRKLSAISYGYKFHEEPIKRELVKKLWQPHRWIDTKTDIRTHKAVYRASYRS